jgi:hypothetical protein
MGRRNDAEVHANQVLLLEQHIRSALVVHIGGRGFQISMNGVGGRLIVLAGRLTTGVGAGIAEEERIYCKMATTVKSN